MKTNVLDHLTTGHALDAEYQPLLDALERDTPVGQELTAKNCGAAYKKWMKEHKAYSSERIEVMRQYAHALLNAAAHAATDEEPSFKERLGQQQVPHPAADAEAGHKKSNLS